MLLHVRGMIAVNGLLPNAGTFNKLCRIGRRKVTSQRISPLGKGLMFSRNSCEIQIGNHMAK